VSGAFAIRVVSILLFLGVAIGDGQSEAGSSQLAQGKTYVIGFSQDTMANDWRAAQVKAVEDGLKAYPFIKFIVTDAAGKTAQQIADIENLVARGVDLLITSPRDGVALTPVISNVYRKGIPVVLLSRGIESEDYTIYIGADDESIAHRAARYLMQTHPGTKKILVLQGVATASTAIARTRGFSDEIKANDGVEIVAIKTANYLRKDAAKAVEEALLEGLAFDAIYAQSDSMAVGARLALKGAGIDPKTIPTVGIDYISEARAAIRSGEQSATFVYPTVGLEGADYAVKIFLGETVSKVIWVPSQMVTKDNIDEVVPIF